MLSFFKLRAFIRMVSLLTFFVIFMSLQAVGDEDTCSGRDTVLISNAVGLSLITTWGILNWDYFQRSPHTSQEGWFSDDTKNGGSDKLGHFYVSYSLSHLLAYIYDENCYSSEEAARLGALSSFVMTSWMEAGDSFSHYGFSWEDFLMNIVGSSAGYLFYTHPELSSKIDFRIEFVPDFSTFDFVTDYEHQKFLIALKLDSFQFSQNNFLKYLELHLGYYTRGYPDQLNRERNIYAGIGLNVSRLFKSLSMPKTSKIFNYIQMPGTYIEMKKNLN